MNIKSKKIMSMMIIAVLVIIGAPHLSQAGLQANKGGTSLVDVTANVFFQEIRKMETQYGTLGKNAILDTVTYLDSTKNGIDSHMQLNTEFGTVGILAYSQYGEKMASSYKDTTTGNASGVYQIGFGKSEFVAGIYTSTNVYTNVIGNSDARYYNKYISDTPIAGDGIGLFGFTAYYPSSSDRPIFTRSCDSAYGSGGKDLGAFRIGSSEGNKVSYVTSRAVVVCGTGL